MIEGLLTLPILAIVAAGFWVALMALVYRFLKLDIKRLLDDGISTSEAILVGVIAYTAGNVVSTVFGRFV